MHCQSCTIKIGARFIEQQGYRCGGFIICGQCKQQLEKRGHIRLDGGRDDNFRLLYSDGSVKNAAISSSPKFHYKILSVQS